MKTYLQKLIVLSALLLMAINTPAQCPLVQIQDSLNPSRTGFACVGDIQVLEQVQTAPGLSYSWFVSGGTLLSPNGNSSITVQWNSAGSGNVDLTISGPNCMEVGGINHNTTSVTPPPIQGPAVVCDNDTAMYTVTWHEGILSSTHWGNLYSNGNDYRTGRAYLPNYWIEDTLWVDWSSVPYGSPREVRFLYTNAQSGCSAETVLSVASNSLANADLGPDQATCLPSYTFNLSPGGGFSSYLWNTNATTQQITTSGFGTYWVQTTDANGCVDSDTIDILLQASNVNLGQDTTVCPGTALLLDAGTVYANYLWSDNSTSQSLLVTQPGLYSVTVSNPGSCTASDTIEVLHLPLTLPDLGQDTSVCPDTTLLLDAGPGYASYLWSDNSTGQTLLASPGMLYWVEVGGSNGCLLRDTIQIGILSDCIWPGDANHDGVAGPGDVLSIGVAFGSAGAVRPGASQSWYGQTCPDWSQSFPGMVNYKHADSDGNGVIDNNDTLAVFNNFGLTHNRIGGSGSGIPLYLKTDVDTVPGSNMISAGLYLGDALIPADTVYGLALTLSFDPAKVDLNSVGIAYPGSFLGTVGQDALSFTKPFLSQGEIAMAIVRNDQSDQSGQGRIATLHFRADSSYWQSRAYSPLEIGIDGALLISSDFALRNLAVKGDTVVVQNPLLGKESESETERTFFVYPNPSASSFTVEFDAGPGKKADLKLIDLAGRVVGSQHVRGKAARIVRMFEVDELPVGIYFLEAQIGDLKVVRKVLVSR